MIISDLAIGIATCTGGGDLPPIVIPPLMSQLPDLLCSPRTGPGELLDAFLPIPALPCRTSGCPFVSKLRLGWCDDWGEVRMPKRREEPVGAEMRISCQRLLASGVHDSPAMPIERVVMQHITGHSDTQ